MFGSISPACMYVYHFYIWYPWYPERCQISGELELQMVVKQSCLC